jgi:hypothetical protein
MIILSAQRVSSRTEKGINCSIYRSAAVAPRLADGRLDAAQAFDDRGDPVAFLREIKPGGNRVSSYVDVALLRPEPALLDAIVHQARLSLGSKEPPLQLAEADVALELNMDIGLYTRAPLELDELVSKVRPLLSKAADDPAWKRDESLHVRVIEFAQGTRYELTPESIERILRVLPDWGSPSAISISHDVRADFERTLGPFRPQLALLVTRLDEETLLDFGGVTFEDKAGTPRGRWPPIDDDP